MKKLWLILILLISSSAVARAQDSRRPDVFSPSEGHKETQALKRLPSRTKKNLQRTLAYLKEAILTASTSSDFDEIAHVSMIAGKAVDAIEPKLPNGSVKGSLRSCRKALDASFLLRMAARGDVDPQDPDVARTLEEVMLKYELTRYPPYERAARVINFARTFYDYAKDVAGGANVAHER